MPVPAEIIDEILAKARGDRGTTTNQVLSPRGVADLPFDNAAPSAPKRTRTIRIFPEGQTSREIADRLGSQFLRDALMRTFTVMECNFCMTVKPGHVANALESFLAADGAMRCNVDLDAAEANDDRDCITSDYDGSDMEEDESSTTSDDADFDEAYPPVSSIRFSDRRFKDQVVVPLMHSEFRIDVRWTTKSVNALKEALYAYLVAKLSECYRIPEQVEEASTLLELAAWKAKIDGYAAEAEDMSLLEISSRKAANAETKDERERCRVNCGADVVVRNVLPYLFAGVSVEN